MRGFLVFVLGVMACHFYARRMEDDTEDDTVVEDGTEDESIIEDGTEDESVMEDGTEGEEDDDVMEDGTEDDVVEDSSKQQSGDSRAQTSRSRSSRSRSSSSSSQPRRRGSSSPRRRGSSSPRRRRSSVSPPSRRRSTMTESINTGAGYLKSGSDTLNAVNGAIEDNQDTINQAANGAATLWNTVGGWFGGGDDDEDVTQGCLPPFADHRGPGYEDEFRGWYDVQGCGKCNDYCRWVGDSGSGGSPEESQEHGSSYWSCRLAGGESLYSPRGHFDAWGLTKCSDEGATAP